jgi:hypothetical protein
MKTKNLNVVAETETLSVVTFDKLKELNIKAVDGKVKLNLPEVYLESDYSKFVNHNMVNDYMNRDIDEQNKQNKSRSFECGIIMVRAVVLVWLEKYQETGKLYSVDGGHTIEVFKEKGIPVPYTFISGTPEEISKYMINLNANAKSWSLLDYTKHYAGYGVPYYVKALQFINDAKNVLGNGKGASSAILSIFTGKLMCNALRNGKLEEKDINPHKDKVIRVLDICKELKIQKFNNAKFVWGITYLFREYWEKYGTTLYSLPFQKLYASSDPKFMQYQIEKLVSIHLGSPLPKKYERFEKENPMIKRD